MTPSFRPTTPASLILAATLALSLTLALASPSWAVNDDQVLRHMDSVLEENARLHEEAYKAHKSRDKEAARQAAEALDASEERVEKTRTEALAHVAGVSPAQVEQMRKEGKSWGQAAGELGVHPGFLGIAKAPLYEPASVRRGKRGKAEVAQGDEAPRKGRKGRRGKAAQAAQTEGAQSAPAKKGKKAALKAQAAPEKEQAAQPAKKKHKHKKKTAE